MLVIGLLAVAAFLLASKGAGVSQQPDAPAPTDSTDSGLDLTNLIRNQSADMQTAADVAAGSIAAATTAVATKLGGSAAGALQAAVSAGGAEIGEQITGNKEGRVLGSVGAVGVQAAAGFKLADMVSDAMAVDSPAARWAAKLNGAMAIVAVFAGPGGLALAASYVIAGATIAAVLEFLQVGARTPDDARMDYANALNSAYANILAQCAGKPAFPSLDIAKRFAANFADGYAYELNRLRYEWWANQKPGDMAHVYAGYTKGVFVGAPHPMPAGQHPATNAPRPPRLIDAQVGTSWRAPAAEINVWDFKLTLPIIGALNLHYVTDNPFVPIFEAGRQTGNIAAYVAWMNGTRNSFESDEAFAKRGLASKAFVGALEKDVLVYNGARVNWKDANVPAKPVASVASEGITSTGAVVKQDDSQLISSDGTKVGRLFY